MYVCVVMLQVRNFRAVPQQVHPLGRVAYLRDEHPLQPARDIHGGMPHWLLQQLRAVCQAAGRHQVRRPLHELQEYIPGHQGCCWLSTHEGKVHCCSVRNVYTAPRQWSFHGDSMMCVCDRVVILYTVYLFDLWELCPVRIHGRWIPPFNDNDLRLLLCVAFDMKDE